MKDFFFFVQYKTRDRFVLSSSPVRFFSNLFITTAYRRFESTWSPDGIPRTKTALALSCRTARCSCKPATLTRGTSGITRFCGRFVDTILLYYTHIIFICNYLQTACVNAGYIFITRSLRSVCIPILYSIFNISLSRSLNCYPHCMK